jgi:hypothetical protein
MKKYFYDAFDRAQDLENFNFRNLHPKILLGTASDLYAGWIGQIYTADRYKGRISRRTYKVGGKASGEEVLLVDSLREYFEHFSVLEIDYTFYSPLLGNDGKPTQNHHLLQRYRQHIFEEIIGEGESKGFQRGKAANHSPHDAYRSAL